MFHRLMNFGEMDARPAVVLTRDLIKKAMPKFKRHDDLVIVQEQAWEELKRALPIPVAKQENSPFSIDEDELASLVCQTIQKPSCRRLAVERSVKNDDYRTPNVRLILGDSGLVSHKENHITYTFDVTKCMFSAGNISEKKRMADLDCSEEVVVDLFAGIGYFSLPLLARAKAKHLYACEWNPDAIEAFRKNLTLNKIEPTRCTLIEGDNRSNRPTDVAQRVVLGILPSCSDWMQTALECVDKSTGATLHCHVLVESSKAPNGAKRRASADCPDHSSPDKGAQTNNGQQNQSISSSSSSHSTIEKLSAPNDDKASESGTNSPVLLERPTETASNISMSPTDSHSVTNEISSVSSYQEDSACEVAPICDSELGTYERKASDLIDRIKDQLEAHDLEAKLVHIQPVKSYAPHISHVVFDIRIEPKVAPADVQAQSVDLNFVSTLRP